MDEQVLRYREAKLMEPIYRMFKVIEQEDCCTKRMGIIMPCT